MAKLSHKITNNNDNNSDTNKSKLNFTLSTKVDNPESTSKEKQEKTEETDLKSEVLLEIPSKKAEFLKFLYEKIDFSDFGKINKQFIDSIFVSEVPINEEEATKKIIAKIITEKIINTISETANETNKKYDELFAKLNETKEKQSKQEIQIKNLVAQVDDAEEQIYKTEKKYADTIAVVDLVNEFVLSEIQTTQTREIAKMLIEAYKNGKKQGVKFVLNFINGFSLVEKAILKLGEDEKENIDILNEATKQLMQQISGTSSAERRPILDKIANLCNSYLFTYDFISPEQTLQIDPAIHNAEGLGGTVIKEGLSFAVVRRETRKAVFFAEIRTK